MIFDETHVYPSSALTAPFSSEPPKGGPSMTELNPFQRAILFALNRTGKHVYAGTVSDAERARRRRRNRAQRAARKAGRS